jgi:hypothetical protein
MVAEQSFHSGINILHVKLLISHSTSDVIPRSILLKQNGGRTIWQKMELCYLLEIDG